MLRVFDSKDNFIFCSTSKGGACHHTCAVLSSRNCMKIKFELHIFCLFMQEIPGDRWEEDGPPGNANGGTQLFIQSQPWLVLVFSASLVPWPTWDGTHAPFSVFVCLNYRKCVFVCVICVTIMVYRCGGYCFTIALYRQLICKCKNFQKF